jgi:hypothetical protein
VDEADRWGRAEGPERPHAAPVAEASAGRLALPVWPPSADLGPQAEVLEHLDGEGESALFVVEAD